MTQQGIQTGQPRPSLRVRLLAVSMLIPPLLFLSAATGSDLPEPPEPRGDTNGHYLSPYLGNGTLAPWVGTVMARKMDIDFGGGTENEDVNTLPSGREGITNARDLAVFLSSERPPGLEEEFAAMSRGLQAMEEFDGDVRKGMKLARLLGSGNPDKFISRLGEEVASTVADEAFDRLAEEMGAFGGLLAPIRQAMEDEAGSQAVARTRYDISEFRSQADRSFDDLDRMLVHTILFYRHRDDFEYATEAILRAYPRAGQRMEPALSRAGEVIHAEVKRMQGAEKYDIQWVTE